ncbi:MAG: imidazole glycerol phosphate synthase subunit HisF, partial [Bacteroidetes bacterium]|nr:imidazole glycerol phosphate synthase subunit HisF [Bacteroidota bacterium]
NVNYLNSSKKSNLTPMDFAQKMQDLGAGEIIIQSVDQDGMMNGYDLNLIRSISEKLTIPTVALGGAGNIDHVKSAYTEGTASSVAAGSFFIYQSKMKGVLISYPSKKDLTF